jgi:hypothetical protein
LAEKYVVVIREKGTEGLFTELLIDERIEMREVLAELVEISLVRLELAS